MTTRLAVLGHPIAHSRSPDLHAAAYAVLGLDWDYGRADVTADGLPAFLAGLGPEWRGLSLTMPLKRAVLPLVPDADEVVARLGLANTVVLGARQRLVNTDVPAIVEVLGAVDPDAVSYVLGAGATAASALEALRELGVRRRIVLARDPRRAAAELRDLATDVDALGPGWAHEAVRNGVVISTLPGGVDASFVAPPGLDGERLLDVAYDPWPSPLGRAWVAAGGDLVDGLDMLVAQAVRQIRLFVHDDQDAPLPNEADVVVAMRRVVARPADRGSLST